MGAEALCRGANIVVGIERSTAAGKIIRHNWEKVANGSQSFQLLQGDVVEILATLVGQQFDRIYFDPPYAAGLYQPVLAAIEHYRLLAPLGELAMEHSSDPSVSSLPDLSVDRIDSSNYQLELYRQKVYGNTSISFYRSTE